MVQRRPQALPLVGTRPTGPAQLNFPVRSYVKENQSLPITFQRRPTIIPASSLEVSLTEKQAHLWNGKEFINGGRCTVYVHYLHMACTDC